jgi:hypothetical protein
MKFQTHTFKFNYVPYEIIDDGEEAHFILLKNAETVFAHVTISTEIINRAHTNPNFKGIMLDELIYTLKEFVDKVIEVNKKRLESND